MSTDQRAPRGPGRALGAVFAPLTDLGRAGQVEQRLAEAIRSGVLVEGERLPSEPELAGRFGVAVVTVREALTGLRSQGLVRTRRGRGGGTVVAPGAVVDEESLTERLATMSRHELQDRFALYALVLTGCAELAAERADEEEAVALRDLLPTDDDVDGLDVGAWRHADAELWLSLAALTQSSRITREVVRLEADFGMIVRVPMGRPAFREHVLASHRRLVDAVAAGDPDAARTLAREHLAETLRHLARTQAEAHDRPTVPRSAS